jgi:PAS domain S-box-containing protein
MLDETTKKSLTEQPQSGDNGISQEWYRSLVEDMPALVCRFTPDGTLTFVNTAYCAYFNKSRADLIGINFFQFIPPKDRIIVKKHYEMLSPELPVTSYEHQVTTPSGAIRWQQWTDRAFFDDDGNVVEFQSIGYDITERKQVERRLMFSDQALQQMPNAIIQTDLNGTIQRWLGNAETIFGYSTAEAIGQSVSFMHMAKIGEDSTEDIIRSINETGQYFGELTCRRKDGRIIPVELSAKPIFDQTGEPLALIGNLRDISTRKKSERALQESEERFRLAFENANIGVWLIDLDGRLLRVNNRMCQILGYSQSKLEQMNVSDVTHPDDVEMPFNFVRRSLAGELNHITFEKRYIHKKGHLIWANVSSSLVRDTKGQPLYFLSHVEDITQHKATEMERENLIKELETKNTELERFSYTISHDLKSPLITIQGFLGFLEKDAQNSNTERLKQDIKFIRLATDKMKQLVDDVLELSRLGQMVLSEDPIPIRKLVDEAVMVTIGPLNLRSIQLQFEDNLPTVRGDFTQLLQVFQNLLENATKFMGDEPHPKITIGGHTKGKFAVCFVADNGIGIEPAYHHRIFNLFDRLDQEVEGTGVGLAVAKRIVEMHHGELWVESAGAGQGSTFWLKLPLASGE